MASSSAETPSVCRKAAGFRWMSIINYVEIRIPPACSGAAVILRNLSTNLCWSTPVAFPRNAGCFESDTRSIHSILGTLGNFCKSRFRCHHEWYRSQMRRYTPSTWMISPATAVKKISRSIRVMFYKRKSFLVWWSTPLMARTSSAVCGTICGCRYAGGPSLSQSVRVKWTMRRLSVLCDSPFLLFSPKDAASAKKKKNLLARRSMTKIRIVAFR
jgi:hypothetical protein